MTYLALALLALAVIVVIAKLRGGSEALDPNAPPPPPPSPAEVQRLITAGKPIEAIKVYRKLTGLGLYDAKQAIDRISATGVWEAPAAAPPPPNDDEAVMALVRENKLIEAIKVYRERHGGDLAAAKQAVERLAAGR